MISESTKKPSTPNFSAIKVRNKRLLIIIILSAIIILGSILRLDGLGDRTAGHSETFAPGLNFPRGLSVPFPRITLYETIKGTIAQDVHPPAWYIAVWGWTKLVGANLYTVRFPSVLFGVASIPLLYVLGTLIKDRWTGLLASGLLAFSGVHIFWSQVARPSTMACFLSLLSTVMLLLLSQGPRRYRLALLGYMAVSLVGLATLYYYWLVFAVQILWVVWGGLAAKKMDVGLLRSQLLVLIVGSPLITLAAFQSQESYLSSNAWWFVSEYIQFGFLFLPHRFASSPPPASLTLVVVPFVSILLLAAGFMAKKSLLRPIENSGGIVPSLKFMALISVLFFLVIVIGSTLDARSGARTHIYPMYASSAVPLLVLLTAFLVSAHLNSLYRLAGFTLGKVGLTTYSPSLVSLLVVIPPLLLVMASVLIPLFAPQHMLMFTPFLLLLMSTGAVTLSQRAGKFSVAVAVVFLLVLGVMQYFGVDYHKQREDSALDYQGLAEQWIPKIEESDVIMIRKSWRTTPIFYYLDVDRHDVVSGDYAQEILRRPDARVWVTTFAGSTISDEDKAVLASYDLADRVESRGTRVELYVPQ